MDYIHLHPRTGTPSNKMLPSANVVLTGRSASKELLDRADLVNEVREVESPKDMATTKGIQH
jgi:ATP:corrinoid adenosyltransferase